MFLRIHTHELVHLVGMLLEGIAGRFISLNADEFSEVFLVSPVAVALLSREDIFDLDWCVVFVGFTGYGVHFGLADH